MPLSKAEFSIKAMCWVLRVARSGRYARCSRYHRISQRQQFRLACDAAVLKVFIDAKQKYGVPRLTDELPEYNIKTIDASLRRQGLRAKDARKFRPVSYREHGLPVCENLPKQNFYASA
jgi:putative transposase